MSNEQDAERLGFKPRMVIPIVGVTFEGRQASLKQVKAVFDLGHRMTNYNEGFGLYPEPDNKHDHNAIGVWAATRVVPGGKMDGLTPIGYVPKQWCPGCGSALTAKEFRSPACPSCSMALLNLPQGYLNKWLNDKFVREGKPLACGITWVGVGAEGETIGMRVGLAW